MFNSFHASLMRCSNENIHNTIAFSPLGSKPKYLQALIYSSHNYFSKNIHEYNELIIRLAIQFHLSHGWWLAIVDCLRFIFTWFWLLLESPLPKLFLDNMARRQKGLQLFALFGWEEKALEFGDIGSKSTIIFGGAWIKKRWGVLTGSGFWSISRISRLKFGRPSQWLRSWHCVAVSLR